MRRLSLLLICAAATASAHHPDRQSKPVRQRFDVIGAVGNRLPESYRREYNRPTYLGGKIAYWIAPSSQEAMAWHTAAHMNAYKDHRPRTEKYYFYPKPWEALRVGPRFPLGGETEQVEMPSGPTMIDDDGLELPTPIQ